MERNRAALQAAGQDVNKLSSSSEELAAASDQVSGSLTTIALATRERPALFFTVLGEPPLKMLRYQQQFDYFDSDRINRSIRFIDLVDDIRYPELRR